MKYEDAQKIEEISYDTCIEKKLKILDATALVLARDNTLPIFISSMTDIRALHDILSGKPG